MDIVKELREYEAEGNSSGNGLTDIPASVCAESADEIYRLRRSLEYAYRVVNFGFEYGSFDMSVLRKEAKAYFEKFPEGQL